MQASQMKQRGKTGSKYSWVVPSITLEKGLSLLNFGGIRTAIDGLFCCPKESLRFVGWGRSRTMEKEFKCD